MAVSVEPIAFTIPDATLYSGLSRSRIYRLIKTGDLQAFRVGGRRMIRREALDRFFDHLTGSEAA